MEKNEEKKRMSKLFFYLNKYWKKLLNLKKGWCAHKKNYTHKLSDII